MPKYTFVLGGPICVVIIVNILYSPQHYLTSDGPQKPKAKERLKFIQIHVIFFSGKIAEMAYLTKPFAMNIIVIQR